MADTMSSILAILLVAVPLGWAMLSSRTASPIVRRQTGHHVWCRCPACMATARRH